MNFITESKEPNHGEEERSRKTTWKGYPLRAHPSGQWEKRHKGKSYYFGVWADPQAALDRFNREWPFIIEGREPTPEAMQDGLTIKVLCNLFLEEEVHFVNSGEISIGTWRDYERSGAVLIDFFKENRRVDDLRPADFARLRTSMYRVGWAAEINPRPSSLAEPYVRVRIRLLFQVISEIRGSSERGPTCLE